MSEQTCPDCGKGMEKGFVPDFAYAAIAQMVWHRGEPEPAKFILTVPEPLQAMLEACERAARMKTSP